MVDRLLSMLNQFLQSYKDLKLNDTFKVYLKILSSQHSKLKRQYPRLIKKRKRGFGRLHVGAAKDQERFYWAIDVPNGSNKYPNIFWNKCILTCFVLGLSQHENLKSLNNDYLYMSLIQSKNDKKVNHAIKLLNKRLINLIILMNFPREGPYDLLSTLESLHKNYKCQFFVFEDIVKTGSNLTIRIPDQYDSSLIPIFLFKKFDQEHIIFIKNINSFFKQNGKTCLSCKKHFKSNFKHKCKVTESCFACHRFYKSSDTFYHFKLNNFFCDRYTTKDQSSLCSVCNITLYSNDCKKAHKRLCNSKGFFGFKCLKCNKFSYRQGSLNSSQLKLLHICNKTELCKHCHQIKETDHLCKLRLEKLSSFRTKLVFLNIEFYRESLSQNSNPVLATFFIETEVGCFKEQSLWDPHLHLYDETISEALNFNYIPKNAELPCRPKRQLREKMLVMERLSKTKNVSFESQMLSFLLKDDFFDSTIILQDSCNYQFLFLLKMFCSFGICPDILKNDASIMLIEIKSLALRFVSSQNYTPGDEYFLASQFDVPYTKHLFPFKLLKPYHFNDSILPMRHHFDENDEWCMDSIGKKWCLWKELKTHCSQKVFIFALSILKFLKEFYGFQQHFHTTSNQFFNPFSSPNCSLGGAIFRLFKWIVLPTTDIFTVKNEYGNHGKFVSRIEHQYLSFLEFQNPSKHFLTAFNNPNGQYFFPEAIPDAYCPNEGTVIMVLGCYFHCHLDPLCPFKKNLLKQNKKRKGMTYQEVNEEWEQKKLKLMENNECIQRLDEIWECQIRKKMLNDKEFSDFLKFNYIKHPLQRLTPRNCYRGGYTDNFCLYWSSEKLPNEKLYFCDINGLYSYVALNRDFMVGKYKVLMGKDLKTLEINENKFYYDKNRICGGSILLSILPPKSLFYPFLLYKTKTGENCNTLCKMCCETKSLHCQHSESERALIGNYMISEIEYALTLNYKILHIFECHAYFDSKPILKEFVKVLNYLKTVSSNVFENCNNLAEKQTCLDKLNSKLHLTTEDKLKLKITSINPNPGKRYLYKLAQNSFFGKFGQRHDKRKLLFLSNQSQIDDLIAKNTIFNDIHVLNENICCVDIKTEPTKTLPSLKTNVYLSAQITSYARETIHRHLMKLSKNQNVKVFQVDCDSIIFSTLKTEPCPLEISPAVGDFKNEINGEILSYVSLGPKNYVISYTTTSDKIETIHKVAGLKLTSEIKTDKINVETYKHLLELHKLDLQSSIKVKTRKRKINFATLELDNLTQSYTISNQLKLQRYLKPTENFVTYPFGFD